MSDQQTNIKFSFTVDDASASKALKILGEMNKNIETVKISTENLDKIGGSAFNSFINTILSSKTGSAIQQVNSLASALQNLFGTAGSGGTGGGQNISQMLSASGSFVPPTSFSPNQQIISSILSGGTGGANGVIGGGGTGGILPPSGGAIGGSSGAGGPTPLTAMGLLKSVGKTAAPYLLAAGAMGSAYTAADQIISGEIAERQESAMLRYELRTPMEAARGDITLAMLKRLGVGVSTAYQDQFEKESEQGKFGVASQAIDRAYLREGIPTLVSGIASILKGEFSSGTEKLATLFNPDLMAKAFADKLKDVDKERFGTLTAEMSKYATAGYSAFNQTYRVYGEQEATKYLSSILTSKQYTPEEITGAQGLARSMGLGIRDIDQSLIGTERRFMYSPGLSKLAAVLSYQSTSRKTGEEKAGTSLTQINRLLGNLGVTPNTPEAEVYGKMIEGDLLSATKYSGVSLSAVTAPETAAANLIPTSGLTPENRASLIKELSGVLKGSGGMELDSKYFALALPLKELGITNPADISKIIEYINDNKPQAALRIINKMTGKNLSPEAFNKLVGEKLGLFNETTKMFYSKEFLESSKGEGNVVLPARFGRVGDEQLLQQQTVALTKMGGGRKQPGITIPSPVEGGPSLFISDPSQMQMLQKTPTPEEQMQISQGLPIGASLEANQQLKDLGSGIVKEVADGLEQVAKKIRGLPTELNKSGLIKTPGTR